MVFYLFFLKTPFAESVLAAEDIAFLDRLWQDWCPGYDASEDLRNVKQWAPVTSCTSRSRPR